MRGQNPSLDHAERGYVLRELVQRLKLESLAVIDPANKPSKTL